jgi:hypothetical protein
MESNLNQTGNTTGSTVQTIGWTLDPVGNPYLSSDSTIVDYGNPTALEKETTQTVDQYGNVTQMQIYGYGPVNGTLPLLRTYNNQYLNTSAYTSLYILNRLWTSTASLETSGMIAGANPAWETRLID